MEAQGLADGAVEVDKGQGEAQAAEHPEAVQPDIHNGRAPVGQHLDGFIQEARHKARPQQQKGVVRAPGPRRCPGGQIP